jgi:hypothetical protein
MLDRECVVELIESHMQSNLQRQGLLLLNIAVLQMFRGLYALPEGLVDLCLATALPSTRAQCFALRKTPWRRGLSTNGKQRASSTEHVKAARYVPTVGLELHVQLKTSAKLFSDAQTSYEAIPNTHVRPFDAALPGALPVRDFACLEYLHPLIPK